MKIPLGSILLALIRRKALLNSSIARIKVLSEAQVLIRRKALLILFLLVTFVPFRVNLQGEPFTVIFAQVDEDLGSGRGNFSERLSELRDRRQERLDELREKRDERLEDLRQRKGELKERVATAQAEVRQKVIERIKSVFSKMLARLERALVRLDKIAQRIATRIDKLNARGVDTSAAEQQLTEAESAGAAAAQAIEDAKAAIDAIDGESLTVRDAVHAARDAVRSAKQALKDYHKVLVSAIRELKAARDLTPLHPFDSAQGSEGFIQKVHPEGQGEATEDAD